MCHSDFLKSIGIKSAKEPWSLHLQWSTTQPKNWVLSRNSLLPSDLLLTLTLNSKSWECSLDRRDEIYFVQWRESGINIKSQQLKYRRRVKWPVLHSQASVCDFISELEKELDVCFVKHVNLQGTLSNKIEDPTLFANWLNISINDFGVFS